MKTSKLQQKLIAAALGLALTGVAGGAYATINLGAQGNGGMFMTVIDTNNTDDFSDDRAYVRDLSKGALTNGSITGGSINDWSTVLTKPLPVLTADKLGAGTIFSVAHDANLQSFLAATNDLSRLKWNVTGGESLGTDRVAITAKNIDLTPSARMTIIDFRQLSQGGIDAFLGNHVNPAMGNDLSVTLTGNEANTIGWGDTMGGRANFSNTAGLNESLGFWMLSEPVASGITLNRVDIQQYMHSPTQQMEWHLTNTGDLTYGAAAVVPEPESWAMMAAGLLLIGRIASRRRLNNA